MKSHEYKTVENRNKGFPYYFCFMMVGFRSVPVPLLYGSGRPSTIQIRIGNEDPDMDLGA